ncbi:MAG: hypothetical protein VX482_02790 [Candidatus Thermoplasmatota archaeon]|nr:hypothetical protein [Candidatus Thermoplasmatota archaeon]
MSEILTTLAVFWLCAFVFYVLVHRGLWIFSDVARTMGMFMLEKALGPGIDLVEGRTGSAARAWIMQSALWLMIGGLFTFEGMWLAHEPTALHSLSAWGYDPTADTLAATGKAATAFGGITMALVGCGLHILPNLLGTSLASERNGALVSFLYSGGVFVTLVGSHDPLILGVKVMVVGTGIHVLAMTAVVINQLLTVASRVGSIPMPAWLILLGLMAESFNLIAGISTGAINDGDGQWLMYRLQGSGFFFLSLAGVVLYASSVASGNALWSRTLVGATLLGGLFTLNPFGANHGTLVADLFGIDAGEMGMSSNDMVIVTFLMALASVPVIALSVNTMLTMRGGNSSGANPRGAGLVEINFGVMAMIPVFIGSLFVQTDAVSGTDAISGLSWTIEEMSRWAVMVPLSLGSVLALYPSITGRQLASASRARTAFWLMSGAVLLGLMLNLTSSAIDMALLDAGVEDPSSLSHELAVAGSVIFYFAVVAMILHCLNMVSGLFRGDIIGEGTEVASSIEADTYNLASATTVSRILTSGAGMDTVVVPVGESDEKGSATDL